MIYHRLHKDGLGQLRRSIVWFNLTPLPGCSETDTWTASDGVQQLPEGRNLPNELKCKRTTKIFWIWILDSRRQSNNTPMAIKWERIWMDHVPILMTAFRWEGASARWGIEGIRTTEQVQSHYRSIPAMPLQESLIHGGDGANHFVKTSKNAIWCIGPSLRECLAASPIL